MLVNLAIMEKCVIRNVQHIVLASCATNLRRQQSALLAVRMATMEQAVRSNVHTVVWITSVRALRANVQVVCQENSEAYVVRVSICLNEFVCVQNESRIKTAAATVSCRQML